jgi:undecaprenyl-diphosphatase
LSLSYLDALILGIVEGLTEFLPVSSTGHLTITEKMLGLQVDDPGVTAYTAVIQLGAILATLIYFRSDILRLLKAWFAGLSNAEQRGHHDYQLAWAVIVGSLPVGVVGFGARDLISGPLRSLWVVAGALVLWSAVMWLAESRHAALVGRGEERGEGEVTLRDGLVIGLVQCFSLVPGVSRSGATISARLFHGIERVPATKHSFLMASPALKAAGFFEMVRSEERRAGKG